MWELRRLCWTWPCQRVVWLGKSFLLLALRINICFYFFNAKAITQRRLPPLPPSAFPSHPSSSLSSPRLAHGLGCAEQFCQQGGATPAAFPRGSSFQRGRRAVPGAVTHFLALCLLFLQRCCGRRWPSCRRRSTCSGK